MPRRKRRYMWSKDASEASLQHALSNVSRGAGSEWLEDMYVVVVLVARTLSVFTSDDVWWTAEKLEIPPPDNTRKALGPVMQRCAYEHLIERDYTTEKTIRENNHRRDLNAWRSLITRGARAA